MTIRILKSRKLISHYRKLKLRRTRDDERSFSVSIPGGCNARDVNRKNFILQPFIFKNQGWVSEVQFLLILFIIFPLSFSFPLKKSVEPELLEIKMVRKYPAAVSNSTSDRSFSDFYSSNERNSNYVFYENDVGLNFLSDNSKKLKRNQAVNSLNNTNNQENNYRHSKREVKKRKTRKPLLVTDDVQNYLMTFGYLPPSDRETGLLRTEDQLKSAIKNLQNFANIPATGELDPETLVLLKKPRCGLPDISNPWSRRRKRYTLHGQKWMYTNLTWSLRTMRPRNLDSGQVRAVLYHALDVWARHSKLTFRELNSDRADILVNFHSGYHGDGYAFDGRGQVLAHAFFPGKERGGDAHFDEDEIWIVDPYADLEQVEGTSLFAVAAHEFGHSLGLSHSSVQGALMFPWYQGYEGLKPDFQLPDDDKHAIQQLYGPKDTKLWAKIPNYDPYQPEQPRPEPPREPERPTRPPRPTTPRTTTTSRPRFRPTQPPYRPPYPTPTKIPPKVPGKPDTCNTSYDAISVIRNEVFIFKDKYLWRIGDEGLRRDYPAEIGRLWYGLPENLSRVDAVYERNDKKIVFFIGKWYYVFDANYLMSGYPKPIHYLGLPKELDRVDAAMVWGHNGKTYFFSGTMYWRFDEEVGRVELDYPRDMSMWRGVGYNIDAVFQWKDGNTYFFKGKGFWKFNDMRMKVENEKQTLSASFWMGCPRTTEIDDSDSKKPFRRYQTASSCSRSNTNIFYLSIVNFIIFWLNFAQLSLKIK